MTPNKPNNPYFTYKVDKYNSLFVLVVYEHIKPDYGRHYYSLFVGKSRTLDEQIEAMTSLMILKRYLSKTMILYHNHKRGTGKESDLPLNEELIRVQHGRQLDFSFSRLNEESRQYLRERLSPLSQ